MAVLVGGRSRRFGSDKALARLGGIPLAHHVMRALEPLSGDRLLVGLNAERALREGWRAVPDMVDGLDAMGGLVSALAAAREPWVFVAACDLPRLPAALVEALWERREGGPVVPEGPDGLEPLAALYPAALLEVAQDRLARGRRAVRDLVETPGAVVAPWRELAAVLPADAFHNVNRPGDLG